MLVPLQFYADTTAALCWYHCSSLQVPPQLSAGTTAALCWYHCSSLLIPLQFSAGTTAVLRWYHCSSLLVPLQFSAGTTAVLCWYHCSSLLVPLQFSAGTTAVLCWYHCSSQVAPPVALHALLLSAHPSIFACIKISSLVTQGGDSNGIKKCFFSRMRGLGSTSTMCIRDYLVFFPRLHQCR